MCSFLKFQLRGCFLSNVFDSDCDFCSSKSLSFSITRLSVASNSLSRVLESFMCILFVEKSDLPFHNLFAINNTALWKCCMSFCSFFPNISWTLLFIV